jgi:hypothetical protein
LPGNTLPSASSCRAQGCQACIITVVDLRCGGCLVYKLVIAVGGYVSDDQIVILVGKTTTDCHTPIGMYIKTLPGPWQ